MELRIREMFIVPRYCSTPRVASVVCLVAVIGLVVVAPVRADYWHIQTVDSPGNVGLSTSVALDDSGYAHISYWDYSNGDLKYAAWDGSSWNTQTADSAGYVRGYTSLALDSSGDAHISYYDATTHDLKYATNIPEPATTALFTLGLLGLAARLRRRRS